VTVTGLGIKNDQIDLQGIGLTTSKKDEARVSFTEAASNWICQRRVAGIG